MSASKRNPSERLVAWAAGETFICAWSAQHGSDSRFTKAGFAVYGSDGRASDICKIAAGKRLPEDESVIARIREVSPAAASLFQDVLPSISPRSTLRERKRVYGRVLERLGATDIEVLRVATQAMPFQPHGYNRMPRPDSLARLTANVLELRLHKTSLACIRLHQCWWTAAALVDAGIEHPALARVAPALWEDILDRFGPRRLEIIAFGEPEDFHAAVVECAVPDKVARDFRYRALRSSVAAVLRNRALPEWTHPGVSYGFSRSVEAARASAQ